MRKPTRKTFRHGNVKSEATDAAYSIVIQDGPDALSVRAVASEIGVAHRSLYNHFKDRDALLRAVGARGYRELVQGLRKARAGRSFIRAYAEFALECPHLYHLMMAQRQDDLAVSAELREAVDALIACALRIFGNSKKSDTENRRTVMKNWMLLHGGLTLQINGLLKARSKSAFIRELLEIFDA